LGLNRGLNLKAALETEIKTKSAKRKKEKNTSWIKNTGSKRDWEK
jgi:hypothetical protein